MKFNKPIIYALALHIILLGMLLFSWQSSPKLPTKKITVVNATIYKASNQKPNPINKTSELVKPSAKPVTNLPKKIAKPAVKPEKPVTKSTEKKDLTPKTKPVTNKTETKSPIKQPVKKQENIAKEELPKQQQNNLTPNTSEQDDLLADLIENSKNYQPSYNSSQQSQINNQTTAEFDALIGSLVSQRWIIPASATRGMMVEINISFNPNGTIANANVVKSSGNLDLDNSAIAAIESLSIIYEIQQMSYDEFQLIRNRTLVFSPTL